MALCYKPTHIPGGRFTLYPFTQRVFLSRLASWKDWTGRIRNVQMWPDAAETTEAPLALARSGWNLQSQETSQSNTQSSLAVGSTPTGDIISNSIGILCIFTLNALHLALHTLHSTHYTLHFTLHTLHFELHTPHFTPHTPGSTLYTSHFTLGTPHSNFPLDTPHSALYTPHFTLDTPHFTLDTPHATL